MAFHYHSNDSTSSTRSAKPADIDDTSRLRSRSSKDKFLVSQNRTRIPSTNMPRRESRGIQTAEDLLAAEPGTSSTHQAGRPINYSFPRNVGPASSAWRDAGDLTTLRTQQNDIAAARPNARGGRMTSNMDDGVEDWDYGQRPATEIPRTVRNLADISTSLGSESSTSDGVSRVVSTGSITTNSRDFSGSSSSSQGQTAARALEKYNTYARENGLSLLEDEEIAEQARNRVPIRKSGSLTQIVKASFTKVLKKMPSKSNMHPESKGELEGKTIEELCKAGLSGMYLPEDFAVGKLVVPTFLHNLMVFIDRSEDKKDIFAKNGRGPVIAKLYKYFASQLPRADDERKYERGAASTSLPQHIEFDAVDVTCVLKKIACHLECGFLGSWSLFQALSSIYRKFKDANSTLRHLQAKLIALTITSIHSIPQKSFLIAFLGLASMIGHQTLNTSGNHESVACRGLGVFLGPCLIGESLGKFELDGRVASLTETRAVTTRKYEFARDVTQMLASSWPDVVKQLHAIESREDLQLHAIEKPESLVNRYGNLRLASERSWPSRRLPGVQEDAEPEDDSRNAREEPLYDGHMVDRRTLNSSQATSSSQGAAYSSSGSSVRHHSDSGVGHLQRLQHPYINHAQEQSEQGLGSTQYFSAQRDEPHVQSGNKPGRMSSFESASQRDQIDGQGEEDFGQNQSFSASMNEPQLQLNDNRLLVSNVQTQPPSRTQSTGSNQTPSETGATDTFARRSDPTGLRPSSRISVYSQQVVQRDHHTQLARGNGVNGGDSRSGDVISDGNTSRVLPSENPSRSLLRGDPNRPVSHFSDDSDSEDNGVSSDRRRWGVAHIEPRWYEGYINNNEVPWTQDSTQGSSSLEDTEAALTSLTSRHMQQTPEIAHSAVPEPSSGAEDHTLATVVTDSSHHHDTNSASTSTSHINHANLRSLAREIKVTKNTPKKSSRRTSVKKLALRFESAQRQGSSSLARGVATPAVNTVAAASSLVLARTTSGIPSTAAAMPTSQPLDAPALVALPGSTSPASKFTSEVLKTQTRDLLTSPEARPLATPLGLPAQLEEARIGARAWSEFAATKAAEMQAELDYATRAADAWSVWAARLEGAVAGLDQEEGHDVEAAKAHEEHDEGEKGNEE